MKKISEMYHNLSLNEHDIKFIENMIDEKIQQFNQNRKCDSITDILLGMQRCAAKKSQYTTQVMQTKVDQAFAELQYTK